MALYRTSNSNETLRRRTPSIGRETEQILHELDLNQYSEEERMLMLGVVKRDLEVRTTEQSRLTKLHMQILSEDKRIISSTIPDTNCNICKERFRFLLKTKKICDLCKRPVCKVCCKYFAAVNNWLCSICINQIFYKAMVYHWFYENAPNAFADYASNALIKTFFKEKVPVINDVPEDQLHKIVTAHLGPSRNAIINGELITPELMKNAQASQINQFRQNYSSIKSAALDSLSSIRAKQNVSEKERQSQTNDVIKEFTKNTHNLLSQMFQMLCITLEKYNVSLGINGEQTSTMVLKIAESEVQSIVGKKISIPNEYLAISAEDDLETSLNSVTGGPEEFLSNALLEDLFKSFANLNGNKKVDEKKITNSDPKTNTGQTPDSSTLKKSVPNLNGDVNYDSQKPPPSHQRALKPKTQKVVVGNVSSSKENATVYRRSISMQDVIESDDELKAFRNRVDSITQSLPKARDLRHSTRKRVGQSVMIEASLNDPERRKLSSVI